MHSITLHTRIKAAKAELYPYFLDFEKFGELHPLMQKVTKTGTNTFYINESVLLLGFIPMKPEYTVEVAETDGTITYNSHVRKGVDLQIRFSFSEDGNGYTTITEQVDVKAITVIARILLHTIKKAHTDIFRSLERLMNP
ncbi:MAG: hypothetical protein JWO09_2430 [Bacteroidetes bacterium]|nr:hypothetical protein [Bacteroidota bacterium]